MAQAQAAADAHLAVLQEHERISRATNVPLFKGHETKDPELWFQSFETTARCGKWTTDELKINHFEALMRDEGLRWYKSVRTLPGLDFTKFQTFKDRFYVAYAKKATAKTFCTNFRDLYQKPKETVHDLYARIAEVFEKLEQLYPEELKIPRMDYETEEAEATALKEEGAKDGLQFVKTQFLLAGMKPEIRTKIQEAGTVGLVDILDKAGEIEKLNKENQSPATHSTPRICAVDLEPTEEDYEDTLEAPDTWNDEEIAAINAVRQGQGRPLYRKKTQGPNGGKTDSKVQCRYCKKYGHFQRDCRSRKRDKAPMVGADGKPYQPRPQNGGGRPNNFAVQAIEKPGARHDYDDENEPEFIGTGTARVASMVEPSQPTLRSRAHLNF